eukprot:CAMPEP_0202078932 /NCGR_PEP_ID=MMETSP0964-20121228/6207_1 /ASSEMBLY_ACC=CAM_ASM_000500 /TAXON_ID=4773 /ORGANISM="Schizochytrium aggregatum, Strain ATCC28209" /LENGTH=71 /DNA_ID=CAMNT_0048646255 /DNA_START=199 /DNA_END=411 /DNA_ORIENTATION=-
MAAAPNATASRLGRSSPSPLAVIVVLQLGARDAQRQVWIWRSDRLPQQPAQHCSLGRRRENLPGRESVADA